METPRVSPRLSNCYTATASKTLNKFIIYK